MSFSGKEILYSPLPPAECLPTLGAYACLPSFYEVLFIKQQTPNGQINNGGDFAALTSLRLFKLPKLAYLSNANKSNSNSSSHHVAEDHRPVVLFPNLKSLKVDECRRLKNLSSSAISFHNLTCLSICLCQGMSYLFTDSIAATGLSQVTTLWVQRCKRMTEIVSTTSSDRDGDEDPLTALAAATVEGSITIFSQLKDLSLIDLPCLSGFCSGNSMLNVELPSLET
ncbi:uncharacterized protein LOC107405046 [Ziziphus jujuba]|uniref:Uncharacterized protein LOC107405046 n=1 Tax=Ziziphus jujuba TaxID=326968 RepID=A0A6P6FT05_ZIZJJ|nr:uncharacterized protein LOC107405046 [Ziziphus jujuba]XP_024924690.3 uncharacterized protein LOC107405046 [Ziziphus jujuba]XP_048320669.2 uncharacterized protein LOC107405046 [Ziziphus jujuba]